MLVFALFHTDGECRAFDRYGDLLAHFQMKAHLRGEKLPYEATELDSCLASVAAVSRARNKASEDATNYWIAEYFRQKKDVRTWSALMLFWVKMEKGLASVLLEELGLETQMRINRPIVRGNRLQVRVAGVDVKSGMFRLEEVTKA